MRNHEDDGGYEDPYRDPFGDKDLARLIKLSARLGARYNEEGSKDMPHLKAWIVGVTVFLAGTFIVNSVVLSNQVATVQATLTEFKNYQTERMIAYDRRLDRLEARERNP